MGNTIEEHLQRKALLREQMAAGEPVEINGAIGPLGVWCMKGAPDYEWWFGTALEAWRVDGGPIREGQVRVLCPMPKERVDRLRDRLDSGDVICVKARLAEQNVHGTLHAWLDEIVEQQATDTEIVDHVRRLSEPTVRVDPVLGAMTYDRAVKYFEGAAIFAGHEARVVLDIDSLDEFESAASHARAFYANGRAWLSRLKQKAANDLLNLKNDGWLDDGEDEIGTDEFQSRLSVDTLSFRPDGGFECSFNDGDLFFGHGIVVEGEMSGTLEEARVEG